MGWEARVGRSPAHEPVRGEATVETEIASKTMLPQHAPPPGLNGRRGADHAEGEMVQVLGEDGAELTPAPNLPAEDLRSLYQWMVRLRTFDTRMLSLQRQGRILFFVPSTGEEATMIGTAWALRPEDWVFPAYREQGVAL